MDAVEKDHIKWLLRLLRSDTTQSATFVYKRYLLLNNSETDTLEGELSIICSNIDVSKYGCVASPTLHSTINERRSDLNNLLLSRWQSTHTCLNFSFEKLFHFVLYLSPAPELFVLKRRRIARLTSSFGMSRFSSLSQFSFQRVSVSPYLGSEQMIDFLRQRLDIRAAAAVVAACWMPP